MPLVLHNPRAEFLQLYESEENEHLENEIVSYLQNRMEQLWMECPISAAAISKLKEQIDKLPAELTGKEDLTKRIECLESMNMKLDQIEYYQ